MLEKTSTSSQPIDIEEGVPVMHTVSNETGGVQVMQALPAQAIPTGLVVAGSIQAPTNMAMTGSSTVLATQYVVDLGLQIQSGFRRKLLMILLIQLTISMVIGLSVRYLVPLESFLLVVFPAQSLQTLILGALCTAALPMLTYVRDRHPWNMICTTLWSCCWGIFLGACHVPGGIVRSNSLFVIFGTTTFGVALLLVLCTTITYTNEYGEKSLLTLRAAGWIAWFFMTLGAIFFGAFYPNLFEQAGHFIGAQMVASALFSWVAYDTGKLCERMQPDEYMKGVVYFYTDFLLVCCCCMVMGCVSSGSGAPDDAHTER